MTASPGRADVSETAVRRAVETARRHLLDRQDPAGYWHFDQPTQIEPTAEDLLFREFAGLSEPSLTAATARWIRSMQRPDGGWAARADGPADRCASALAYCALRLAGDSPDAYHLALAAGWIRDSGGLAAAGVRARLWLALFGLVRWEELRVPPPEACYLPSAYPVRMPGEPGWGRPAVLPLSVIAALRPARRLPFSLPELRAAIAENGGEPHRVGWTAGADRVPGGNQRPALLGSARAAALRKCAAAIIAGQQADGSWDGNGPCWFLSLIALHLLGESFQHPALARGLAGLTARGCWTQTAEGQARRLELSGHAVLGTAEAVLALSEAGLPAGHDSLLAAGSWLLSQELHARSGWLAGRRGGHPAMAGDCAAVVVALRRVSLPAEASQRHAVLSSLRWLASVQGRDGGWSSCVPGSSLPLADWRDGRAAAAAELTGQVLAALGAAGQPGALALRRAVVCLIRLQRPDGSWPGAQGTSDLRATLAVVPALVQAGVLAGKAPVSQAAGWLVRQQNPDGGWPGSLNSAGAWPGPADSAPEATAGALTALLAAGDPDSQLAIDRGVAWLTRAQLAGGSWREPSLPADVISAPLRALGQYLSAATSPSALAGPAAMVAPAAPAGCAVPGPRAGAHAPAEPTEGAGIPSAHGGPRRPR